MDLELNGKTALITGGSRGIGLAMAARFAEAGANVMITSRKADDLAEAAADNLKRVIRPRSADGDWTGSPSLHRMHAYLETKTVWHPTGT